MFMLAKAQHKTSSKSQQYYAGGTRRADSLQPKTIRMENFLNFKIYIMFFKITFIILLSRFSQFENIKLDVLILKTIHLNNFNF